MCIRDSPFKSLDGVTGYIVLSSNDVRTDSVGSNYTLYGSAYLIQGCLLYTSLRACR